MNVQEAFNSVGVLGPVSSGMGVTLLTARPFHLVTQDLVALPIRGVTGDPVTEAIWREDATRPSHAVPGVP